MVGVVELHGGNPVAKSTEIHYASWIVGQKMFIIATTMCTVTCLTSKMVTIQIYILHTSNNSSFVREFALLFMTGQQLDRGQCP